MEYLTVDSDLYNSYYLNAMTIDTLRVLKGENSNEIIGSTYTAEHPTINNLVIGEGITKVRGFYNRGINTLELPSTLVEIGANAFGENNLTTLKLPSSVKIIGNSAFYNNNISDDGNAYNGDHFLFENVEIIGDAAFNGNSFETVLFMPGLKEIGINAFGGNTTMTRVEFNYGADFSSDTDDVVLVSIGAKAFRGNGITSASLKGLKDIGAYAFEGNNLMGVNSWRTGDTIETIGEQAFANNPLFSDAPGGYVMGIGCNIKHIDSSAFINTGSQLNLVVPRDSTVTFNGGLAVSEGEAEIINGVRFYYNPSRVCN